MWEKDGVPVCELQVNQQQPHCIPDGTGGFIVAWWDDRNIFADLYAQRIDADGKALWGGEDIDLQNGVPICTEAGVQRLPQLVPTDDMPRLSSIGSTIERTSEIQPKMRSMHNGWMLMAIRFGRLMVFLSAVRQRSKLVRKPWLQVLTQQLSSGAMRRSSDYDIYIQRVP